MFQSEWNRIVDELKQEYGDQVEFIKVDGQNLGDISYKYQVSSFPTFVYVEPNTKGLKAIVYRGDRNYEQMKSWMKEILGPASSYS